MSKVTLRAALYDDNLLGTLLKGDIWSRWRALLIAAMGEDLTPEERTLYTEVTGRAYEPGHRVGELWCLAGRRSGKSKAVSVLAVYIAAFQPHPKLVRGEVGILSILSATVRQAEVLKGYISAVFEDIPLLRRLRKAETADTITLNNGIAIEIRPASYRTIRGLTLIGCLADEVCHWSTEFSADSDQAILSAVRPGLSSTNGQLIAISSPHARKGEAWTTYKTFYGQDDPEILVANGASRTFNPTLSESIVARAYQRDPSAAAAEFGGEFRSDLESYVSAEVVDAAIEMGRFELPPVPGRTYSVFIDPAGGSGKDSFTMAAAHREGETAILDVVREAKPPFSPDAIVEQFAKVIRSYGVTTIYGDRYSSLWPVERFAAHGIRYEQSARPKSELYEALLPLLNAGRAQLLDHRRLVAQLVSLERRVARGGKSSIDGPPNQHEDIANAVAGALTNAAQASRPMVISSELLARISALPPSRPSNAYAASLRGRR